MMSNNYKIPSRYNWIFENGDYSDLLIDNKKMLTRKYFNDGLRKLLKIFNYKEIPKTISKRTIELFILGGYAKVFYKGGKWYCGTGAMSGVLTYDYLPINSLVVNTYLRYSETLENVTLDNIDNITEDNIEKYCFIIPNDELYQGLFDEVSQYAELQTECVLTLKLLLYNARIPTLCVTNSEGVSESFKVMMKDIIDGKPNIDLKGNFMYDALKTYPTQNVNSNAIKDVIECMQYLKATFENNIGLNANYNMKRESLTDGEINLNDDILLPQIDEMEECRNRGFDMVNYVSEKLFNEKVFDIELSSSWKIQREQIENEIEIQEKEIDEPKNNDSEVLNDGENV